VSRSWQHFCPNWQWFVENVPTPRQNGPAFGVGAKTLGAVAVHVTVLPDEPLEEVEDEDDELELAEPELDVELEEVLPETERGQHTSLPPGFVRVHPAATAAAVSDALQSSLRGLPGLSAQSLSVSAPGFCAHASAPPLPVGIGAPQEPEEHEPDAVQGWVEDADVQLIENVFAVLNERLQEPPSVPVKPVNVACAPLTVPVPRVPLSHVTERLQPLCVTSQEVLLHPPLIAQRPL
jgi:hypothetical protein